MNLIIKNNLKYLPVFIIYLAGIYFLEKFILIENFIKLFFFEGKNLIFADICKSIIKIFLILIPFISISLFEIIKRKDKRPSLEKTSIYKNFIVKNERGFDLIFYLISIILEKFSFFVILISFGTSQLSSNLALQFNKLYISHLPQKLIDYPFFIMIIVVLLIDFNKYFEHRLTHLIPVAWECHAFHHSAKEMNIFNAFRQTPHERLFAKFLTLPISTFTGFFLSQLLNENYYLPIVIYFIYGKFHFLNVLLGHSSTKILYPKPFSFIFMSPSLHWIHHSNNKDHFDKNFGQGFTFWDRLFGSYLSEKHIIKINGFGIKNSKYFNQNPFKQFFIIPVILMIKRFKKDGLIKSFI